MLVGLHARQKFTEGFVKYVVNPIAAAGWEVDLAFCHGETEQVQSSSDVLGNSTLDAIGVATYFESTVEPASTHPGHNSPEESYPQAGRIRACYLSQFASKLSSYNFVMRVRPDLEWDGPLMSPNFWSSTAFSARLRNYYGPPLTEDHFSYDYGLPRCERTTCEPGINKTETMVMDDQFFIVPRQHADAVMRFAVNPIPRVLLHCPGFHNNTNTKVACQNEWQLTQYLLDEGVPLSPFPIQACLTRVGGVQKDKQYGCGATWKLVHDCRKVWAS